MTRRLWGFVAAACWGLAVLLAAIPVPGADDCGLPVADALDETNTDLSCVENARDRVGVLAVWLIVTVGVSTAYVAARADDRSSDE